jgi:hypothetical protein
MPCPAGLVGCPCHRGHFSPEISAYPGVGPGGIVLGKNLASNIIQLLQPLGTIVLRKNFCCIIIPSGSGNLS